MNPKSFARSAILGCAVVASTVATLSPIATASAQTGPSGPKRVTCGQIDRELLDAPYVFKYGVSGTALQKDFFGDKDDPSDGSYNDAGFRPVRLTGAMDNGDVRFATKWAKVGGPSWTSRFGLTSDQFHDRYNELKGTHRLVDASGYNTPAGLRFADIWEKNTAGIGWAVTRNVPAGQVAAVKADMKAKGLAPTRVEGYTLDGSPHFVIVWEQAPRACQWQLEVQLTSQQYQALAVANHPELRLIHVDSYQQDSSTRYAGIWWDQSGPGLRAKHGQHWYTFQREFNNQQCDGYVLDNFYYDEAASGWNHLGGIWSYKSNPNIGPASSFGARVNKHVNCTEGRAGAAVINLTTGETAMSHADQTFTSASAIKAFILYSLLRKADAEDIDLDTETLTITDNYCVPSGNSNPALVLNQSYTLNDLATRMITQSHNGATNCLIDFVGLAVINDDMDDLGLTATVLTRYMSGNFSPSLHGNANWFDDVEEGFENLTTPRELATLYQRVWQNNGGLLSNAARTRFFNITDQAGASANNLLPGGFDPNLVDIFVKAGSMNYSSISAGDFAHRPQLGGFRVSTEGGLMQFTNTGEVVVYAVLMERDPLADADAIACIGYEMAVEFSGANAGAVPAQCQ